MNDEFMGTMCSAIYEMEIDLEVAALCLDEMS